MSDLADCGHPRTVCPYTVCQAEARDYQLDTALESFKPPYVPEADYTQAEEYADLAMGEVRWADDSVRKALTVAYLEGWTDHRAQSRG